MSEEIRNNVSMMLKLPMSLYLEVIRKAAMSNKTKHQIIVEMVQDRIIQDKTSKAN